MAKDKYQVSLKAFLKDDSGRVLLLDSQAKIFSDEYCDLPGGRIEVDEFDTPTMDILSREIREELGNISFELKNTPVGVLRAAIGPNKETRVIYILYQGRYLGGEIKISDEHKGLRWVSPSEIISKKLFQLQHLESLSAYLKNS